MLTPPPPATNVVMGRNGVLQDATALHALHAEARQPEALRQYIYRCTCFLALLGGLRHSLRFQTLESLRTWRKALPSASSSLGARFKSATTVTSQLDWRSESDSNAVTSSRPAAKFARVPVRRKPSSRHLEAAMRRQHARPTRAKWFRCHYGLAKADLLLACTLADEGGRVLNSYNS